MENKELIEAKMINSDILTDQEPTWCNASNNQFYESLKAEGLKYYAKEKAGLDTGCDLDMITSYLEAATSILEVGAGYGRVLNYILKNNFSASVTAIERCKTLFDHLKLNYGNKVNLIKLDINHCHIQKNFDLILFLWSGIADFSSKEQLLVIKKLARLLTPSGKLILDIIPPNITPLGAIDQNKKNFCLNIYNFINNIYIPNNNEIEKYAEEADFKNIQHLKYKTRTNRKRFLYILS